MKKLGIKQMAEKAFRTAKEHGFHPKQEMTSERILARLALIHSEVSEATEDARVFLPSELSVATKRADGKPEGFPSELADIIIRVGDLAVELGVDLEAAVVEKMNFNATRPFKHGKRI